MEARLLKGKEVAAMLGVSASFAYLLMKRGDIPTVRIGTAVRVGWRTWNSTSATKRPKARQHPARLSVNLCKPRDRLLSWRDDSLSLSVTIQLKYMYLKSRIAQAPKFIPPDWTPHSHRKEA